MNFFEKIYPYGSTKNPDNIKMEHFKPRSNSYYCKETLYLLEKAIMYSKIMHVFYKSI